MPAPSGPPIGLQLAQAAKAVSRAFDEALAAAGGSLPTWLVLIALQTRELASQRELADAVGVRGATLTHHLDAMEAAGLVSRERDPDNRRVQRVVLTRRGQAAFQRMRGAAVAFDQRLRKGLPAAELAACAEVLDRLRANVAGA